MAKVNDSVYIVVTTPDTVKVERAHVAFVNDDNGTSRLYTCSVIKHYSVSYVAVSRVYTDVDEAVDYAYKLCQERILAICEQMERLELVRLERVEA